MFEWQIIQLKKWFYQQSVGTPLQRGVWFFLQTNGRGQLHVAGRHKGLLATLLLRPVFLANKQFLISKCTALAVCDFLLTLDISRIKWRYLSIGPIKYAASLLSINSRAILPVLWLGSVSADKFRGHPIPHPLSWKPGQDVDSLYPGYSLLYKSGTKPSGKANTE